MNVKKTQRNDASVTASETRLQDACVSANARAVYSLQ